ncbi:MAG: hypothetical protein V2I97_18755 [Desulfococcaceae bacterium]|jgi:hypothetical protein|nr:hypothetical protein [Desulfococcaceae bacterium]
MTKFLEKPEIQFTILSEILQYILFACIESRFIDIDFLHKWTESLIIKSKKPQNWLLDLTICSDSESALNTLRKYLSLSNDILDNEYGEILIGFFYLCYKKNTISFDEFISEVIDVSDAYEIETFNFEELLNCTGLRPGFIILSTTTWELRRR